MPLPSKKELWKFMSKESRPYKFEFVKNTQPLRVSIDRKTIYVNEKVIVKVVKDLVKAGLDWKEIMRKNIMHEKAHEQYYEWNRKWKVPAAEYGWLASYLTDIVIDKIHFHSNARYQKWLLRDSRFAFEEMKRDIWSLFPKVSMRPHFLYNQAAYWIATNAITLDEATNLYPEKADYIVQMSGLFKKIKSEEDLEWAFFEAKKIYLRNFSHRSTSSCC